jgi:adenosylcobinamide-phosphate synthase
MLAGSLTLVAALGIALALDAFVGEYPAPLHPVVWMGLLISALLRLAPQAGRCRQLLFGCLLVVVVAGSSAAGTVAVLEMAAAIPWLQVLLAAYLLKGSFALCELRRAAWRVVRPLEKDDLAAARSALRELCSRDPSQLDRAQLLAGVIESLAENACDSFVAPLFWLVIGGVPAAITYRAINTLDARVGYRGQYEWLGKPAARLDDAVNWLPARLTACLLLAAGWLLRFPVRHGWHILRRDGRKTPSPNGGRPMAVMAGLLEVELAKPGVYVLGDARRPVSISGVRQAWHLVLLACGLMSLASLLALGACGLAPQAWSASAGIKASPCMSGESGLQQKALELGGYARAADGRHPRPRRAISHGEPACHSSLLRPPSHR